MSKFTKILIVLVLILLIEIVLIYRGLSLSKKTTNPDIEDYNVHKPVWVEMNPLKNNIKL